jgi:uncharacterized protein
MAHVKERMDVDLDDPVLVEGLPGVGLVGKIAADHVVDEFDMDLYATVHCESLAPVAVYHDGGRDVRAPVRIYAAPEADLLVLQSDVPVNKEAVREFADCFTTWLADVEVDITELVEHAEEIREKKEQFAAKMQQANEQEASKAQPLRMYQ